MKKQILLPIFLLSFIFVDAQTSFTVCDSITPANMTGSGYVANCLTTTDTCCVYHLSLPIPSWANITDIRNTTSYWAVGPNTMMNGSCRVSYSGCTASLLSCPMPTWGACVREREFMLPDISPCIPPIQCDGYAMDFELHLCRCVGAPFGCSSAEITSFQSWIVCISGTTTICTGVGEINIGNWKNYPNPTNDKIIFESSFFNKENCTFILYDVFGRMIKKEDIVSPVKFEISLKDFCTGVYFCKIMSEDEVVFSGKVVKE